jgi:TPR repeat protein
MSKKMLLAAAGLILGLQSISVLAVSITSAKQAIEKQDYTSALEDLKVLIDEGNADATNLMGQLYENGWGVEKDAIKAKSLYDRGARQGNISSLNSLRKLKNIEYKVELDALLPQVNAGNASAQNRAGEMYEFGYGADRDGAMAFKLYQLAADQGFVAAQHNLGRSYNFATGVEQNFEEAERWYLKAAKQGYTNSMFFLGTLYSNGYGKDSSHPGDIIAYAWMHNAAALGNGTAASIETRLLMKLQENQMDEAKTLAAAYENDYVKPFK